MRRMIFLTGLVWLVCLSSGLAEEFRVYTIKKGDTLSEIAWTLKIDRQKLLAWNPDLGIVIHPGQKIRYLLPADELKTAVQSAVQANSQTAVQTVQELADQSAAEHQIILNQVQTSQQAVTAAVEEIGQRVIDQFSYLNQTLVGRLNSRLETTTASLSFLGEELKSIMSDQTTMFWEILAILLFVVLGIFLFVLRSLKKVRKTIQKAQVQTTQADTGKTSKNQPKIKLLKIRINGREYIYRPLIDEQGKFVSLHRNPAGNRLKFENYEDYKRSIFASFKRHPELVEQERKAGRLSSLN